MRILWHGTPVLIGVLWNVKRKFKVLWDPLVGEQGQLISFLNCDINLLLCGLEIITTQNHEYLCFSTLNIEAQDNGNFKFGL